MCFINNMKNENNFKQYNSRKINMNMAKKAINEIEGEIKVASEGFKVHTCAFFPVTYEGKMSFFTAEMNTKLSYNEIVNKLIKIAKDNNQFYKELVKIVKENKSIWENPNYADVAKIRGVIEE